MFVADVVTFWSGSLFSFCPCSVDASSLSRCTVLAPLTFVSRKENYLLVYCVRKFWLILPRGSILTLSSNREGAFEGLDVESYLLDESCDELNEDIDWTVRYGANVMWDSQRFFDVSFLNVTDVSNYGFDSKMRVLLQGDGCPVTIYVHTSCHLSHV